MITKRNFKKMLVALEFTSEFSHGDSWIHRSDSAIIYVMFSRFNKVNSVGLRYVGCLDNDKQLGQRPDPGLVEYYLTEKMLEITESQVLKFLSRDGYFTDKIREIKLRTLL